MARYLECFFNGSERNELIVINIQKYDINDKNFGLDKDTMWKLRLLCLSSIILGNFNEVDAYKSYMVINPINDYESQERRNYRLTWQYITMKAITSSSIFVCVEDLEYDKLIECRGTLHLRYLRRILNGSVDKYTALKYTYIDGLKYIYRLRKEQAKKNEEEHEKPKIEDTGLEEAFELEEDLRFPVDKLKRTAAARTDYCFYITEDEAFKNFKDEAAKMAKKLMLSGFDVYQIRSILYQIIDETMTELSYDDRYHPEDRKWND